MKYTANPTGNELNANVQAAIQELNRLAAANVEKSVTLQLTNLQAYAHLGLERIKAATEINNVDDWQAFLYQQPEAMKTFGERVVADTRALMSLHQAYVTDLRELTQRWVAGVEPRTA